MKITKKASKRVMAETDVEVAPEATELLFEAEDVAELVADVTGEDVEVEVSDEAVEFTVGEDVYEVAPEGDEELLEASTRLPRGRKAVKASTRTRSRRVVRRR